MSWARNLSTFNRETEGLSESELVRYQEEARFEQESWDVVVLGGTVCPGVATVSAQAPSGLDHQKPKGQKKTFTVDNGDPPVRLKVKVELLPDEFIQFRDNVLPILRPRSKRGGRDPLSIGHPMAEFFGVENVTVDDIDVAEPRSGGTCTVTLQCFEWTAAPAPVKTKGKVQTTGSASGQERPFSPISVELPDANGNLEVVSVGDVFGFTP